PQRLTDQAELELLQIAQAAVDQLGGPARRTGRQVTCLDQRDGQPAGGRVERRTGAGHATPDHEHVEALRLEPGQVGGAPLGRELPGPEAGRLRISKHAVHSIACWSDITPKTCLNSCESWLAVARRTSPWSA